VQSPAAVQIIINNAKPKKPTHITAYPNQRRWGSVLQSVFYVMVFVANTLAAHLFFLKDREKNKRAAANATNKNPCQKNCLKLNNIM
jgi:hypothetical protein